MIDEKILKNEERAILALRSLYQSYGYLPFKMSKFEEYDLYVQNKDFLVSDRVITFNDTSGKLLALKPDVTLSIIKNTATDDSLKHKVYYNENVYRVSAGTGQFKEIMQTGLECIGDIDVTDVYEVLLLAAKSLSTVSSDFVIDISHMGLLTALLEEACDSELFEKEIIALIAEKNAHEAKGVCQKYSVSPDMTETVLSLISLHGNLDAITKKLKPICKSDKARASLAVISELSELISDEPFFNNIRFDFSVINNMKYYDGLVFKGFIEGICEGVLSGGEYGKLLSNMGRECGAVGFALYIDLLSALDKFRTEYDVDVLILYNDETSHKALAEKKRELVANGLRVCAEKKIPTKLRYKELVEM